ncbi:MAG: hypothetical protein HPY75_12090 [Actinobacteria bacterium]|nr:hypothetical protein [Actinomycetota bacterium]
MRRHDIGGGAEIAADGVGGRSEKSMAARAKATQVSHGEKAKQASIGIGGIRQEESGLRRLREEGEREGAPNQAGWEQAR